MPEICCVVYVSNIFPFSCPTFPRLLRKIHNIDGIFFPFLCTLLFNRIESATTGSIFFLNFRPRPSHWAPCGKMPPRRLCFGLGLIQQHGWWGSQLEPYAWLHSSTAFDVRGRKKESLLLTAESNFRGLETKQRWYQPSPYSRWQTDTLPPANFTHFSFSIFLLPPVLVFFWTCWGKPHKLN